jgi:hypothetical protein
MPPTCGDRVAWRLLPEKAGEGMPDAEHSDDAQRRRAELEERTKRAIERGEEAVDRSRNLRHLLMLQRALRALRLRRDPEDPPPPATH